MTLVKGIAFIFTLTIAAFSIWLCMCPVALCLLPIHSNRVLGFRRKYLNLCGGLYLDFASALLTTYFGTTKILLYRNNPNHNDENNKNNNIGLIISNHRCRVDWMYAGWCYAAIMKFNFCLHIILKDSLRSIPIYGWAMQLMQYIFLSRNRDKDMPYMIRSINYLLRTASSPIIFLFPEGTDLSDSNKAKCRAYSSSNNLPQLDQVLYPKSGGLLASIQCMKGRGLLLHDITIAYVDYKFGTRPSEMGLLYGRFPKEVHLFIDEYKIDELPTDKVELDQVESNGKFIWKPETSLSYHKLNQDDSKQVTDISLPKSVPIPTPYSYQQPNTSRTVTIVMSIIAFIGLLLVYSIWARWVCTCFIILSMAAKFANGYDMLELALHGDMVLSSPPSSSALNYHGNHNYVVQNQHYTGADTNDVGYSLTDNIKESDKDK